jgi:hypothetical protein
MAGAGRFVYPNIADSSAASQQVTNFMKRFFEAKSTKNVAETMAFFHPDVNYVDATLGGAYWTFTYSSLEGVFAAFMPGWGNGTSYATRITGSKQNGAVIEFTDTPELFGGDLRIIGSLSFKDGLIHRWIDVWDFRGFDNNFGFGTAATASFFEGTVTTPADTTMTGVVNNLVGALSAGDHAAAAALFSYDAIFEDQALKSQHAGSINIGRFLERAVANLPYGTGSSLQIARGTSKGGGYEFVGSAASQVNMGTAILVLNDDGLITRFTVVYNSLLLPAGVYDTLRAAVPAA